MAALSAVFEPSDAAWRGLGVVAGSGLTLRPRFRRFDASARYPEAAAPAASAPECRDGDVIAGRLKPPGCAAFGTRCTPSRPLGAAMVSAEGTCAAYYRFRRPPDATASPGVATPESAGFSASWPAPLTSSGASTPTLLAAFLRTSPRREGTNSI